MKKKKAKQLLLIVSDPGFYLSSVSMLIFDKDRYILTIRNGGKSTPTGIKHAINSLKGNSMTSISDHHIDLLQSIVLDEEISGAILKGTEGKYRAIFETVPASIVLVDKDGHILDINPYHLEQIGKGKFTKEEFLKYNLLEFPTVIKAGISEKYKKVLQGTPIHLKNVFFEDTSGGESGHFNIRGIPLLHNSDVIGAIMIHEDVTELKHAEAELIHYKDHLEELVEQRTAELKKANDELKKALAEVKTLRGIVPICSYCKKIRDDKGYWNMLELYLQDHAGAELTHGVCPDCYQKHFIEEDED
jgi:PAS domain S-box-containing protein